MRYAECIREDGDCGSCSLSSYGKDCHNAPINHIAFLRKQACLTQKQLADTSNMNISQIQRLESGEMKAGNITLKNALALADALKIDARDLLNRYDV